MNRPTADRKGKGKAVEVEEDTVDEEVEGYLDAGRLLSAVCLTGDMGKVRHLIEVEQSPVFFQDPVTGWSALHVAASIESVELMEYLLEHGAVWNAVDELGNTAGDLALSLNNKECYDIVKMAGVSSEFSRRSIEALIGTSTRGPGIQNTAFTNLTNKDTSAAGSSDTYLNSKLVYRFDDNGQEICEVEVGNGERVGVMMGWELPIMQRTVEELTELVEEDWRVLNIGFGLGIIDSLFQEADQNPPKLHVIIEAHPDVLAHMREQGWYDKPGVVILEGKWQQFLDKGAEDDRIWKFGGFDVVYTDTFSEEYSELHKFFQHVPNLLRDQFSRFSWFNGLGATNPLFYDVYTLLADIHIDDLGLEIAWNDVEVHGEEEYMWSGTRKYFVLPYYKLPICYMADPASRVATPMVM